MNAWQVLRQLQYLIRARDWSGTSTPVFGRVLLASRIDDDQDIGLANLPLCILRSGGERSDPEYGEEPDLLLYTIMARLCTVVESDPTGEASLVGSNYGTTLTSSAGAGLLQIERELFAAVKRLQNVDGVAILARISSAVEVGLVAGSAAPIAVRDYQFDVLTTVEPYFHPPTRLAATGAGGSVTLTWKLPPTRFDTYRLRLFRGAGVAFPAYGAGTEVALGSDLPTSVVDTPGAGPWAYALYATYDSTSDTPALDTDVSDGATQTVTA